MSKGWAHIYIYIYIYKYKYIYIIIYIRHIYVSYTANKKRAFYILMQVICMHVHVCS